MKTTALVAAMSAVLLGPVASAAIGQEAQAPDRSTPLGPLMACRAIRDDAARLNCFDGAAAAMVLAPADRARQGVDRGQAQGEGREQFGARRVRRAPDEADQARRAQVDRIDDVLSGASADGDGNWILRLRGGSVWRQTDGLPIARPPRAGDTVTVLRAALGSYRLRVGGQRAVRAKRIR